MSTTLNQCPACRSPLPAMITKCEACGHEIQADTANKSVLNVAERFEAIESELSGSGLSGAKLEAELKARKGRFIRDFPVPNGREDLLSLLHYIAPRLDGGNADPNVEDWRAKFKEVTTLAKNSFKNNAKVREQVEEIERSVQVSMAGALKNSAKRSPIIAILVGLVVLLVVVGLGSIQMQKRRVSQCEEQFERNSTEEKVRLDAIFARATNELKSGNFSDALVTGSNLRWSLSPDCRQEANSSAVAQWDQKRSDLDARIRAEESKMLAEKKAADDKKAGEDKAAVLKAESSAAAEAAKAATAGRKAATDNEY